MLDFLFLKPKRLRRVLTRPLGLGAKSRHLDRDILRNYLLFYFHRRRNRRR